MMSEEQVMSSLSLAKWRQGKFCSRSLLVTTILFGLSVAAYGDTINTINSGTDPFITYTTTGTMATDCGAGCVVSPNGPAFGNDTDVQEYAFSLNNTYETYMYTSGYFYGGFAPVLSLYQQVSPTDPYSAYAYVGASNVGGPPCNLPTAAGSPAGAIDSGIGYNGECLDEDLTQTLGPGNYLLVMTEYGNTANGPILGDPNNPSGPGGLALEGQGDFTSSYCGNATPGSAFNLVNVDCSAAALQGNWITTIDTVTSPEPEPGVLLLIGTLLIFGSRRALNSFRNRQEK
jgi:hypothetical protein